MTGLRISKRALAVASVLLAVFVSGGDALAQSSTPPLTVPEIQACTCQERLIEAMRPELEARQAMRMDRQNALSALEAEIAQLRASIDPNNQAQQDTLKSKIYQSNQLRDQIRRDYGPTYNAMVRDFNATIQSYNDSCANRRMIAVDVATANETLSCPALPQY